jgi:hypothetical protein
VARSLKPTNDRQKPAEKAFIVNFISISTKFTIPYRNLDDMFTWRRPTSVIDAWHLLLGLLKHALIGSLFYTCRAIWLCLVRANELRVLLAVALARKYAPNKLPTTCFSRGQRGTVD